MLHVPSALARNGSCFTKSVAALGRIECWLLLAMNMAGSACSSEQVQPANAMPGAMEEGSEVETGASALEPTLTAPGELPMSGREPNAVLEQGPPLSAELPDLVLDSAYLLDTTRFETRRIDDACAVEQGCATGLGERRVVRFGSRIGNVGNADLVLGAPIEQNPLWARDACTGGFALPRFARYELRDPSGRLVLQGSKNPACVTDAEEWIPESGADCRNYSCGRQGLAPGCADNYGIELECQWLDITDVPPGSYELEVILNAERSVAELDYSNNSATLQLQISPTGGTVLR